MTLPTSGSITTAQVNTELGLSATANITMNNAAVRTLFAKSSGVISMSDGWGKSLTTPTVEYLVVAGGGGGGGKAIASGAYGGGGGAGGLLTATGFSVPSGTPVTVTVGTGGAGGVRTSAGTAGGDGTSSAFHTVSATGGGGGGQPYYNGRDGGSGGGGGGRVSGTGSTAGGSGTAGQGYAGGGYTGTFIGGCGGGGAGGAGSYSSTISPYSLGGAGVSSSITGVGVTYAVGAGATVTQTEYGSGGAALGPYDSLAGNSGIVVIRYANTYPTASSTTGSPAYSNTGGYHIYTWTASGSITF